MDRIEFRTALASRIEKFRLDECGLDVFVKKLSALDRARIVDRHRALEKAEDSGHQLETVTKETQCYIVARGLVDEKGGRLYKDDELQAVAEEIPATELDALSRKILSISGMGSTEPVPNSNPTRNEPSSSGSPLDSGGGIPTPSLIN